MISDLNFPLPSKKSSLFNTELLKYIKNPDSEDIC